MTDALNPAAEVDPDSVTALFDRDPLTLDDAALDRLILELRNRADANRAELARKDAAPKATKARAERTDDPALQAKRDMPTEQMDLEDLIAAAGGLEN